jgi:Predicted membrane protein (DUF2207)
VLRLEDIPISALFPVFHETVGAAIVGIAVTALALVFAVLATIRKFRARHARKGFESTLAEYKPPEGLNVMVAAHLLDRPKTAIPAQLLELAVNKNIKLLDYPAERGATGYSIQFLSLDGTDPLERQLLTAIFGDTPTAGAERNLVASDRLLVRAITRASASAVADAGRSGLRGLSSGYQWANLGLASLTMVALLTGCLVLLFLLQYSWWVAVAFVASTASIVISARSIRFIGPLTSKGAAVRDHLIGLKKYLQLAEEDRLRILQTVGGSERFEGAGSTRVIGLYEKLLPYAVIWGIEETWIRVLIGNVVGMETPPRWLSDPNSLSVLDLFTRATNSWRTMATELAPVGRQSVTLRTPSERNIY